MHNIMSCNLTLCHAIACRGAGGEEGGGGEEKEEHQEEPRAAASRKGSGLPAGRNTRERVTMLVEPYRRRPWLKKPLPQPTLPPAPPSSPSPSPTPTTTTTTIATITTTATTTQRTNHDCNVPVARETVSTPRAPKTQNTAPSLPPSHPSPRCCCCCCAAGAGIGWQRHRTTCLLSLREPDHQGT